MLSQYDRDEIVKALVKQLHPGLHFSQRVVSGTTPFIAGGEFTIQHDLNRNMAGTGPNGNEPGAEFIWWLDDTGTLYEGDRASWTADSFTLKCSASGRGYVVIVR